MRRRQSRAALEHLGEGEHLDRAAAVGQTGAGVGEGVAVIVDLGPVIEDDDAAHRVGVAREVHGVGEMVDRRGDDRGFGLGDDGLQRRGRRTRLQRNGHRAAQRQGHVDDRVVHAGEAQQRDAVTGCDVGEGVHQGVYPGGQFGVGDGVESGEEFGGGASGLRIADEAHGALPQRGPRGVAVEHGGHDLGKAYSRLVDGVGDGVIRGGGGEFRIGGVQVGDAAGEPLVAGFSRHQKSSQEKIVGCGTLRCAHGGNYVSKTKLIPINGPPALSTCCESPCWRGKAGLPQRIWCLRSHLAVG
ncbi:hypothetical protein MPSYJ_41140 [Mycolicibacterium psychrotolerans]|uniref:Uncharacterized protein n=1 Tax=Mycolicibacterium psychrotolerans TaxID=216929 RepID=A0A7I7MGI1_9MYCO|nr:hypothetical protein MPSYJ_41140 [Mycolicibacterium psychrotolerans]